MRAWLFALIFVLMVATSAARSDADEYWAGRYICKQGETAVILSVKGDISHAGGVRDAIMFFYATRENPSVPEGCIAGTTNLDLETGAFSWKPDRWIIRPENYELTEGSIGKILDDGRTAIGQIRSATCTQFIIRRVAHPPRQFPEECAFD